MSLSGGACRRRNQRWVCGDAPLFPAVARKLPSGCHENSTGPRPWYEESILNNRRMVTRSRCLNKATTISFQLGDFKFQTWSRHVPALCMRNFTSALGEFPGPCTRVVRRAVRPLASFCVLCIAPLIAGLMLKCRADARNPSIPKQLCSIGDNNAMDISRASRGCAGRQRAYADRKNERTRTLIFF